MDQARAPAEEFAQTVERLRADNARLAQQVKRLIQTEQDLYATQEQLDGQVRVYRSLYQVGQKLSTTLDLEVVLQITTSFVLYELNFERCLLLLRDAGGAFAVRALDGFYDDALAARQRALALAPDTPALAPLLAGQPQLICAPGAQDAALRALGEALAMDEYYLLPLPGEAGAPVGLLAAGNSAEMAAFQTRVAAESLGLLGLANLTSLAATAITNTGFYHALQEERRGLEARIEARTHELLVAKEAAEAANVAKSSFLANMSHELRTPLNAVLGFAQVLERDRSLSPRQREYLEIITRSGEHLLGLINAVLEMSKIEAGRVVLSEAPFDLHRLLASVEEMFRLRAEARGLHLLFELAPGVPRYVAGDEGKLRQVLINLLGNAVKFTHEGGVGVRAAAAGELHRLRVEVEDSGEGIAEEQLPSLFQAFTQTASGIRSQEGTGLGLAISRQFVRLMGGEITVRSAVGRGTLFAFEVELRPVDQAAAHAGQARRRVVGIAPGEPRGQRMLVVDDKWENRRLLVEWLSAAGFAVREAANGQEAVELWETWEPHLIWMDMRMPVMDGYEATRRIKASLKGQATVVVALTASAFEHEQVTIRSAGCDDFVHKPAREAVIFDTIARHLGVGFLYDEPELPEASETAATAPLDPRRLAALPPALVRALAHAAEEVDPDAAAAAIAQIGGHDPALAAELEGLVAQFRFDTLQQLTQVG
ncbi:MAG TPA: ATP-binding protein [Chloroflexaceae bacterium]|nr:ATP-binding protein [Chloroflexaceae bacterium]